MLQEEQRHPDAGSVPGAFTRPKPSRPHHRRARPVYRGRTAACPCHVRLLWSRLAGMTGTGRLTRRSYRYDCRCCGRVEPTDRVQRTSENTWPKPPVGVPVHILSESKMRTAEPELIDMDQILDNCFLVLHIFQWVIRPMRQYAAQRCRIRLARSGLQCTPLLRSAARLHAHCPHAGDLCTDACEWCSGCVSSASIVTNASS